MSWIYPDDVIEWNGDHVRVRDLSASDRFHMGVGHGGMNRGEEWRITERAPGPWPYEIDMCPYASSMQGFWTRDEQTLFCPGCGFNGT